MEAIKRPFVMSEKTTRLIEFLRSVLPGESFTYEDASAAVGFNVRAQISYLRSAMNHLRGSREAIFDPWGPGRGYMRLTDDQIAGKGGAYRKKIHRAAKRGVNTLASVQNFEALPNERKIQHNAEMSMLGAVWHATRERKAKQIEAAVATTMKTLPVKKTLELFGRGEGEE